MKQKLILLSALFLLLTACGKAATSTPVAISTARTQNLTATPTASEVSPAVSAAATETKAAQPIPHNWSSWPVIPIISERVRQIYTQGRATGVTPYSFSVVGDCQSDPDVFMGIYATERNPIHEDSANLYETINLFKDSFSHVSVAVKNGLSAPSALDPLWSDPKLCQPDESPVVCEMRLYKPMIVFVNLGTNWKAGAAASAYERYLRQVIDQIISAGAIPILTTKADNVEGDHSINLATAQVAYDYDIPLMNFWLAADSLPNHGLEPEGGLIYLTPAAWDVRNYTGLRTLDTIWRAVMTDTP